MRREDELKQTLQIQRKEMQDQLRVLQDQLRFYKAKLDEEFANHQETCLVLMGPVADAEALFTRTDRDLARHGAALGTLSLELAEVRRR